MRNKIKDIIINSYNKNLSERKEFYLNGAIIQIINPFTKIIDLSSIVAFLKKKIPDDILSLVDVYYIGNFDVFKKKNTNAAYMDGAIYISNDQDTEKDLVDDIIHELGHALIERDKINIFSDNIVKNEFIVKKQTLKNILKSKGYHIPRMFNSVEFSEEVDNFLFKEVGYDIIGSITNGLFTNPYAITSLEEYYSSGFEDYFLGKSSLLKKISPELYKKVEIYDELEY